MSGKPPHKKQTMSEAQLSNMYWEEGEWHLENDPQMQKAHEEERAMDDEQDATDGNRRTSKSLTALPIQLWHKRRTRQFAPSAPLGSGTPVAADGTAVFSQRRRMVSTKPNKFEVAFDSAMLVRAKVLTLCCWAADNPNNDYFRKGALKKADAAFVNTFVSEMNLEDADWKPPAGKNMPEIYRRVATAAAKARPIDFDEYMGVDFLGPDYEDAYDTAVETYKRLVQVDAGAGGVGPVVGGKRKSSRLCLERYSGLRF